MKVGLAQIGTTVGDLGNNVARCTEAVEKAASLGAELAVLPEMAVSGYPPRDILCDPSFISAVAAATEDLAERTRDFCPVIAGTVLAGDQPTPDHPGLHNAAVLLSGGAIAAMQPKRLLPAYDVFHEARWFDSGESSTPTSVSDTATGLLVCEDLWDDGYPEHPGAELRAAGAEVLVTISASPFRRGVFAKRINHARRNGGPLVFVNACGGQDELIFDGRSFAIGADGRILTVLPGFTEAVEVVDLNGRGNNEVHEPDPIESVHDALVLGTRDFAAKNRIDRAFLGLSGGIDSALVAVIAARALGPEAVTAVAMPSRYTDERSTGSARELADNLGIGFEVVPIHALHDSAESSLAHLVDGGTTAENIQARLRAMILMAHVNRHGGMLLNTSNKTELTLGYSTLYGDMAGTLAPIADLTKPEVVSLALWINREHPVIPQFTLDRPPSAELKENQVDPFDYDVVAPAVDELVHSNQSNRAMLHSEHKRWQMGVILKVSEKAFGTGRMIPITRR